MNNKPIPDNWYDLKKSFYGISDSLCALEDVAKKMGDEKLLKLVKECSEVDNKIYRYLNETYSWE